MLYGFSFEDLATYRFTSDGRNLIEDFLKRRGWRLCKVAGDSLNAPG
jgi:hypothetical protein